MTRKKSKLEKLMLHALLMGMAVAFVYPFMWMFFNSMKISDEIAQDAFTLLPKKPLVKNYTPFIDVRDFEEAPKTTYLDKTLWEKTSQILVSKIKIKINKWKPILFGDLTPVVIPERDKELYKKAMCNALQERLIRLIPDKYFTEKYHNLNEEALSKTALQLASKMETFLTDDDLKDAFSRIYRNIAFSKPKIMVDMVASEAISKKGWQLVSGDAYLNKERRIKTTYDLVNIDYSKNKEATLEYKLEIPEKKVPSRIYIGYKSDNSWARMYIEVQKYGKIYRSPYVNFTRSSWFREQLRWEDEYIDSMEPQYFSILKDTGETVANKDDFILRVKIVRGGIVKAMFDKAFNNYFKIFKIVPFMRYIMTSFAICILTVILSIFSCTFTAYAFARLKWTGRNAFFALMMATMMIPPQVTMIPGFLINRSLGFYNTLLPLWVFLAFGNAFFVFLLRQFMLTLPADLEDAARIDGCGVFRIYWNVVLPLVKPTMCTIAIFTFIGTWNNFMGPLIYVSDERLFPLAFGLFKFNLSNPDTTLMMAGSFIMTMPIIIVFFFAQKFFIQGVALTGTKG